MSILSDFEDRIGGALEGMFAGMFRSPVQPVEIARALGKAMDDGRTVGVGTVYAPISYTVALSPEDTDKLGAFLETLSGELATYLTDHAREQGYRLTTKPHIDFVVHDDLRLGRSRVSARLGQEARAAAAEAPEPASDGSGAVAFYDHETEATAPVEPGLGTVTVGDLEHDVALRGDRVTIGRLRDCDICLADANASRTHAAFVAEDGGWAIEDLGSSNGTLVNGEAVERRSLRDGDVIEVGLTRLTFHQQGR